VCVLLVLALVLDCGWRVFPCRRYEDGDGKPTKVQSIFAAMWWCLPTLMTIGYGDVVPLTPGGKAVAAVTAFIGVIVREPAHLHSPAVVTWGA
jgi:hypothetical protein